MAVVVFSSVESRPFSVGIPLSATGDAMTSTERPCRLDKFYLIVCSVYERTAHWIRLAASCRLDDEMDCLWPALLRIIYTSLTVQVANSSCISHDISFLLVSSSF